MFKGVFCYLSVIALTIGLAVTSTTLAKPGRSKAINVVSPMPQPSPPSATDSPGFNAYKGVTIGSPMDLSREKLGDPKDKSDSQDFFILSDNESAQVLYDSDHKVSSISVNYIGKLKDAPTPVDVFGSDAEPKADGSIFKMVQYPKAGYSISYNRTPGEDPMVVITIKKLTPQ